MIDPKQAVLDTMRQIGRNNALAFQQRAVAEASTITGTEIIANETWIPDWRQKNFQTVGVPVRYKGQVYTVWQAHDSSENPDWNPLDAVSLFDIHHTTDPARAKPFMTPQGARGLYKVDDVCIWEDEVWRCVQSTNFNPTDWPEGWRRVSEEQIPELPGYEPYAEYEPTEPSEPGDDVIPAWEQPMPGVRESFLFGERVTHNGYIWESAHPGENVWEPGVHGWIQIGLA